MENEIANRVLPSDTIAEQAIIGSMMVNTEAVTSAVEKLRPEDFYREDNREIYSAMLELYSLGKQIDMITVKDQLTLRGTVEQIGGLAYLATLIDNVPVVSNVESYVKIVEEKSVIRKLINVANGILKVGYSQSEDVDTIIEQTEKNVFDVLQDRNTKGYSSLKEVLVNVFDDLEDMYQNKRKISGIESGFIDLDAKISGLNPSDLIIIAARPAMGKTAFVLNIATYVAMRMKVPVMMFSLEMSAEQMAKRIIACEAEVDNMKLKNADLSSDEWLKLGQASGKISEIPLYIEDTPGLSASELRAKCRKAKLEKNIGLIIIDYLQLMESKNKSSSRQQEITEISRSLKILAKELNIPVIALSQLSRASEARTDHKPLLSDLRESGAIEQDADIVMFLHREDYYNPDTEKKNIAEVILAKNRSGSTGTVELAWSGQYTRFANIYRGPEIEGV